jgi:hypothetical protein
VDSSGSCPDGNEPLGGVCLPENPVGEWWSLYRSGGEGDACQAVAEWWGNGNLLDPETERGRLFQECLDDYWPVYYFYNWFDPEDWRFYEREEVILLLEDVESGIAAWEDYRDGVEPELLAATEAYLEIAYRRLAQVQAFLDE